MTITSWTLGAWERPNAAIAPPAIAMALWRSEELPDHGPSFELADVTVTQPPKNHSGYQQFRESGARP